MIQYFRKLQLLKKESDAGMNCALLLLGNVKSATDFLKGVKNAMRPRSINFNYKSYTYI